MRKNEEDQSAVLLLYGKSVLIGGIGAMLLSLLLLFLAAMGISFGLLDASLHNQIIVVACILSSLCGGIFAVRRCPGRRLFVGIAVGTVQFLLQLSLGLLLYDTLSLENGGIGLLSGSLCGGAAAGILCRGGRRQKGQSKKQRKY